MKNSTCFQARKHGVPVRKDVCSRGASTNEPAFVPSFEPLASVKHATSQSFANASCLVSLLGHVATNGCQAGSHRLTLHLVYWTRKRSWLQNRCSVDLVSD